MKNTSKTAMGAMIAALSLALMLSTAILPFMTYAVPMIAGALIVSIVIECDKIWAFFVYLTVSILSLLIIPDKSAALAYTLYFGYYPILKSFLESKTSRITEQTVKYIHINVVVIASYYALLYFFGFDTDGVEFIAPFLDKWYVCVVLVAVASLFLKLYDTALTKGIIIYNRNIRKKFKKFFR